MKTHEICRNSRGDSRHIEPCAVGLSCSGAAMMCVPCRAARTYWFQNGRLSVAYGARTSGAALDEQSLHNAWKLQNPIKPLQERWRLVTEGWAELSAMLTLVPPGPTVDRVRSTR